MGTKARQRIVASPFWTPTTIGESIEGTFNGFERTPKSVCLVVGDHLISVSTVIQAFLKPVWKQLKLKKSVLKIQFAGYTEKKYAGGNKARLFNMWLDDAPLKQAYESGKLSSKELEKIFK